MAKPKNPFPSDRIRLDANLRMSAEGVTLDARQQVFYDWYINNRSNRKAATIAVEMLTSILNGELGPQVQKAVETGNTAEAIDALQDLLGAFGSAEE